MERIFRNIIVRGSNLENRQEVINELKSGDSLEMCREPTNAYDPNAIALLFKGKKIGYIPKELARRIAPLLDQGQHLTAIVKGVYPTIAHGEKTPVVNIFKIENASHDSTNQSPDPLSVFIDKFCKVEPSLETPKQVLFALYYLWMKMQGKKPISQTKFGILMKKRFGDRRQSGGMRPRVWVGIGFKKKEEEKKNKEKRANRLLSHLKGLSIPPEERAYLLAKPLGRPHPWGAKK